MALSGSFYKSITGRQYIIEWSATQSIENNTSTITCVHKLKNDATYSLRISSRKNNTCTVDGASITYSSSSISTNGGSTITLGTTKHTVAHDSDGTKTLTIKGVFMIQATLSGTWVESMTASQSITLDTIPRASIINSLSCNTSYLDGTFTYKYTPQSASYYNKCNISLNINEDFTVIKSINIGTKSASQQTATVTLSNAELTTIYKNLPTDTSGTLRFTFRTYSDSGYDAQVGSASYKEIKLKIPESIKPSIGTITLDPVNITTADGTSRDILVKGKNKLTVSVSGCAASTGSSIVSYTFSGTNISSTKSSTSTSASVTSSTISTSGTLTYTVKITDKRGRTASKSATITCYD